MTGTGEQKTAILRVPLGFGTLAGPGESTIESIFGCRGYIQHKFFRSLFSRSHSAGPGQALRDCAFVPSRNWVSSGRPFPGFPVELDGVGRL
jgi:hypothetical protein